MIQLRHGSRLYRMERGSDPVQLLLRGGNGTERTGSIRCVLQLMAEMLQREIQVSHGRVVARDRSKTQVHRAYDPRDPGLRRVVYTLLIGIRCLDGAAGSGESHQGQSKQDHQDYHRGARLAPAELSAGTLSRFKTGQPAPSVAPLQFGER